MAKNYDKLTTAPIPDETLLRLGVHILSIKYLEDRAPRFIKITKHNNTSLNYKAVEDEDSKEDGKEAVTDLEEEVSKKNAQRKTKKDAARAQVLLLAAVPELSIPASVSVPMLKSFSLLFEFVFVPRLSAVVSGSFVAMLRLSFPAFESFLVLVLFAAILGLSVSVLELSVAVLESSLPKAPLPDLAAGRQRLDDIISE